MSQTQSTQPASGGRSANFDRHSLFDLTGKVALVTGGGSGIGLMATQALAVNGAKVYISGRTKEKLDRVVEAYGRDIAGEIVAIPADVAHKEGVQELYDEISKREKCLCVLVNNAGVSSQSLDVESRDARDMRRSLFDEAKSTFDDWTETYRTNVASPFFVAAAFLPLLEKSTQTYPGWSAALINITSISGLVQVSQHHFSYNASKAAAVHLNRMLASELATNDIRVRVNSIAPGVFPSEMTEKVESDDLQKSHIPKDKFEGKVPAARPGKDEDMAAAILFAACNQYLSGQTIPVDGGYTLSAGL